MRCLRHAFESWPQFDKGSYSGRGIGNDYGDKGVIIRTRHKQLKVQFPLAAAYHEAGHAIARVYVGALATDSRVFHDGSGYSDGSLEWWQSTNPGIGAMWDLVLVSMAGLHAEARATKRSFDTLQYSHGLKDTMQSPRVWLCGWLAGTGNGRKKPFGRKRTRSAESFLRNCWPTIDIMAIRLRKSGFVSRGELQMLTKSYRRRCVTELVRPIL
jgi:hypothetical protein